jgi:hypothetical protein
LDRPVRESAKNIAIEKGLKRAAESRSSLHRLKGNKIIKKKIESGPPGLVMSNGGSGATLHKVSSGPGADRSRGKKVYSTAKQRLGKILGLKF